MNDFISFNYRMISEQSQILNENTPITTAK